jgi:putative endonuclease
VNRKPRINISAFGKLKNNKQVGLYGENLACNYLLQSGADVIERNFRVRMGEIDIISQKDQRFTFTEVKTRRTTHQGFPEEAVDPQKWARMEALAEIWLARNHPESEESFTLDIISILLNRNGTYTLRRIEDFGT